MTKEVFSLKKTMWAITALSFTGLAWYGLAAFAYSFWFYGAYVSYKERTKVS